MSERNSDDSMERIDETPSRGGGEAANSPPAEPTKSASPSIPRGTDEEPARKERVKASDEP